MQNNRSKIFSLAVMSAAERKNEPRSTKTKTSTAEIRKELASTPVVDAAPPLQMKIIYPNEVSRIDFDATTGEPIDSEESDHNSNYKDPDAKSGNGDYQ